METDNEQSSGKTIIIFGLINIVLVLFLSRLRVFLISTAMILMLGAGMIGSADTFKKGKRFCGVMGYVLNIIAILIYAGEFGMIFLQYIKKFLGFFN
ncbi:MAG: hypothetical protein K2N80_01720 [Lachnospiraceae bacterium]|nr:hypothetical protein [Lachnospiraceae bacterium]